jgi:hypothetical protein
MTVTDEFLTNNENYAAGFGNGDLAMPPAKQVTVLACSAKCHNVPACSPIGAQAGPLIGVCAGS